MKNSSYHRIIRSPGVQGEKLVRLLKEEGPHISQEANGSKERWGVNLDDTEALDLPGPSKRVSDPKIPKGHLNWEPHFEQRPGSGHNVNLDDQSEPLFQKRYGVEDMTGYGVTCMMDMGNLNELQGSPSHVGNDLIYMSHYEEDMEPSDGAQNHAFHTGSQRNRRETVGPHTGSPSRSNINVGGEFSCLLINEEGYLQDQSILYSNNESGDSGSRLSFQEQAIHCDPSLDSEGNMYGSSDMYHSSDTINLGEKLHHQAAGKGARRLTCNQCSLSFPDSISLKIHKQTHKGTGQGPPYSCTQCGKTFTQACNLKVHQRIHSAQGLHLCSHCGKGFHSFSDLKTHRCGQTGDKPYCCTVCGNKFSRLWNLKLHRRIHTQEKPHQCTMCDKSFTRADILKVHQRTHTGERPYCCAVCGLSFKRLDHLKSHQRKHLTDL